MKRYWSRRYATSWEKL